MACLLQELQTRASEVSHSSFKLRDLLTVPMQRVLKYHLLLKVVAFWFHCRYTMLYCTVLASVHPKCGSMFVGCRFMHAWAEAFPDCLAVDF